MRVWINKKNKKNGVRYSACKYFFSQQSQLHFAVRLVNQKKPSLHSSKTPSSVLATNLYYIPPPQPPQPPSRTVHTRVYGQKKKKTQ